MRIALALSLAATTLATACSDQPPGLPKSGTPRAETRNAGARPLREPAGDTGSILGRIVAADTGVPLRRAEVTAAADGGYTRRTVSNADGRYVFREMPAGRYRLSCVKPGFVPIDLGQRTPFALGREIDIGDGETVSDVDFRLTRGAVISGRIADESGEPMARVLVEAVRWGYARGRRVLQTVPSGSATTDDLGQYRLYGLPAGDVYLRASTSYRGQASVEDDDGLPVSYVPGYYPGTPDVAQAQRVTLRAGEEIRGKRFPLRPLPGVRIAGVVTGTSGSPRASGDIALLQFADGAYDRPGRSTDSARIAANGSFVLTGVAPGQYLLQVQTADIVERPDGRGGVFRETRGVEYALMPLVVKTMDVETLRVITSRGATVRGRIVFDPGASPRFGPNSVSVSAPPVGLPLTRANPGGTRASVRTDWTFELSGLLGPRVFRATEPVGWMLKAVRHDGHDITDAPIDFKGNEAIAGIELVLANITTELVGRVTRDDGRAATDYTVVIFPEDPGKWKTLTLPAQSGPASRLVKIGRPDQRGQFRVTGLPPGRYLAVAVESIEEGEWNVIDVLKCLRPLGTPVALADGDRKTVELKLSAVGG